MLEDRSHVLKANTQPVEFLLEATASAISGAGQALVLSPSLFYINLCVFQNHP